MTKGEIINMLLTMHEMTKSACEKKIAFNEISTYVKELCPNIEPEYVELFRDLITPISKEQMPRYLIVGNKLFQYIVPVNVGEIKHPNNLYICRNSTDGNIDLGRDIFTYEELVSKGAKPPYDNNELLKAIL